MDLLSHKDYALFIDHDAMFTTKNWFYQISRIVDKCPDFGVMTVKTNRIGNPFQRYPGIDRNNHDIKYHREIGKKIQKERFFDLTPISPPYLLSGLVILISKNTWEKHFS